MLNNQDNSYSWIILYYIILGKTFQKHHFSSFQILFLICLAFYFTHSANSIIDLSYFSFNTILSQFTFISLSTNGFLYSYGSIIIFGLLLLYMFLFFCLYFADINWFKTTYKEIQANELFNPRLKCQANISKCLDIYYI